jgi:hypothetical protein
LAQTRTFDTYHDVDCWVYSDVHDYIKFVKHGYGKVVDHACREIRLRRMTRAQGLELVRMYGTRPPRHLQHFLDWLGITENAFHFIIDQQRNSKLWRRNQQWQWEMTYDILPEIARYGKPQVELSQRELFSDYQLTPKGISTDHQDKYILIGKGHP